MNNGALGALYDQVCAEILLRLDDWKTCREARSSPGQMRSLTTAKLVSSSPNFRRYGIARARSYPLVYRRTRAGDRAADLIRAATASADTPTHRTDAGTT